MDSKMLFHPIVRGFRRLVALVYENNVPLDRNKPCGRSTDVLSLDGKVAIINAFNADYKPGPFRVYNSPSIQQGSIRGCASINRLRVDGLRVQIAIMMPMMPTSASTTLEMFSEESKRQR